MEPAVSAPHNRSHQAPYTYTRRIHTQTHAMHRMPQSIDLFTNIECQRGTMCSVLAYNGLLAVGRAWPRPRHRAHIAANCKTQHTHSHIQSKRASHQKRFDIWSNKCALASVYCIQNNCVILHSDWNRVCHNPHRRVHTMCMRSACWCRLSWAMAWCS